MGDQAQQILAPAGVPDNLKALAWDAFNQAKDPNDLATRLKVLSIPDSVKADLWDAKAGKYSPAPNQGLAGVARPTDPMAQQPQSAAQRFANNAGIPTRLGTIGEGVDAVKNLIAPEASPDHPGFGQTLPIVGPLFRAQRETYDKPGIAGKLYGSIPIVGPAGYQMSKALESGDNAGAAGSALNIFLQTLGMKGTNLAKNAGAAASTLGDAANAVAPAAGKAAGMATTGAGVYNAITHGNPEYLLSALAHKPATALTQSSLENLGSLLKKAGAAANPAVPEAFGQAPMFTSAMPDANNEMLTNLRARLALPPAPTELGPSSTEVKPVQREGLLPAKSITVSDGQGGLKKQYLTSVDTKPPLTNYTLEQGKMINNLRAELETPRGTSMADQQAVDQRMAEYAKTPWENEKPPDIPDNETPLQRYLRQRAALKPAQRQGEINVYPDANARGVITVGGEPVTQSPQRSMSSLLQKALGIPSVTDQPQVVGNGDLTDILSKSIARARAAKAGR